MCVCEHIRHCTSLHITAQVNLCQIKASRQYANNARMCEHTFHTLI